MNLSFWSVSWFGRGKIWELAFVIVFLSFIRLNLQRSWSLLLFIGDCNTCTKWSLEVRVHERVYSFPCLIINWLKSNHRILPLSGNLEINLFQSFHVIDEKPEVQRDELHL